MKVTSHEIKTVVQTVAKHVRQDVEVKSKSIGSEKYITNALDAIANSARAGISVPKIRIRKEDVLDRYRGFVSDGIKEYVENCKDNSVELDTIDTLLSIIDKKVRGIDLQKNIFRGISKESKFSENIINDIKMLKDTDFDIYKSIPVLKNKDEAVKKMKIGSVFQIEGEKTVSIKNREGKIEALSMTGKDYIDLFPPVSRFASTQSCFGNCYEVTALNAIMDNPRTRENILRCFDTISKKDMIIVNLPNSVSGKPIEISKYQYVVNLSSPYFMRGAGGFQLIEHSLGKDYADELVLNKVRELEKQGKDSSVINLKCMYGSRADEKLVNFFDAPNKGVSLDINLRDGGVAAVPWYKLGLTKNKTIVNAEKEVEKAERNKPKNNVEKNMDDFNEFLTEHYLNDEAIHSEEEFAKCMWSPEFFENNLVEASFTHDDVLLGLRKGHSYHLKPVLNSRGEIESYLIKDPHSIVEQPLSFEDAINKIDVISFAEIK